jgi:hypothetical protein
MVQVVRDTTITETKVYVGSRGDTTSTCRLTFIDETDATITGPPVLNFTGFPSVWPSRVLADTTEYSFSADDNFRLKISNQGGDACQGTNDPYVYVEFWGYETS